MPERTEIVTLTTDFGHQGGYVAALKGVILSRAPRARIVDVSHEVAPQNILEGAFLLAGLAEVFPPGTVHLAVVDPGVGTDRRLVAARVDQQWFVAPDNGLLAGVLQEASADEIREIRNPSIRRSEVSATFHGRDILAPAAALLVLGGDPAILGPTRADLVRLPQFEPVVDAGGVTGEVIFCDTFGNLVTNIRRTHVGPAGGRIELAGAWIDAIRRTYAEEPTGALIALIGSSGWLEIAVVNGDAARRLGVGPGATVRYHGP